MLETVTLEEAQGHLPELIAGLTNGEEVLITQGNRTVARLIGQSLAAPQPRKPGSASGKLIIHADDDEHLKDFEDYLP
ncbi:MAG TPA: antitoxin of toxin-antitoxin stability system [Blastocatellia bacterium]|nr:antitoxin of toxin-antitoxin stability system [Blastocatellia bacterium]HMV81514.1 antitoxin of toxin-antitoxin stability system [Blastocatellia bacterium]HMY76898.1 antitoxin of toxin-antitoxin stability system [Blastocatellia bacterium]HMZ21543.1 antitoxin of toxin-antitoxin stability system [Blastocatellia bacterium]HNG28555.1 antitoxin of toxin-antitoxin stability system [Blastocatellia bacterium]